jgi:aminopeptidase N
MKHFTLGWTGNLVTNSNFEHFWLNEGFTVFVERKINGRLHGEQFRNFTAIGGKTYLKDTVIFKNICATSLLLFFNYL